MQPQQQDSSSTGPGAQGTGGHNPGSGAPLGTGRGQEDTGQQGLSCHGHPELCRPVPTTPRGIEASVDWELQ